MNNKKLRVSTGEFAEVLYRWLSLSITEKEINEKAKDFGFKTIKSEDTDKVFTEMLAYNMWLIVFSCEAVIEDEYKSNECLDIFHRYVYEGHFYDKEQNFLNWQQSLLQKYDEYYKARETEHPSTPSWVVAKLLTKNVLGENTNNLEALSKIMVYEALTVEYLGKTIKNYDIEQEQPENLSEKDDYNQYGDFDSYQKNMYIDLCHRI